MLFWRETEVARLQAGVRALDHLGLSPPGQEKLPPIREVVRVSVDHEGRSSRPAEDSTLDLEARAKGVVRQT